jgi:hypothetical protein
MLKPTQSAIDQRARRAARRAGLWAHKSRWQLNSIDNYGGFMLINDRNLCVAGERYQLSAEEVIEYSGLGVIGGGGMFCWVSHHRDGPTNSRPTNKDRGCADQA